MIYFPFHVGDYMSHTAHLDLMEDLAYRRMLDLYYLTEGPLPSDWREIARLIRMREHGIAIEAVLTEFFTLTDEGWFSARCDAEIKRMQDKQAKAKASAAISVARRSASAQLSSSTSAQRTLSDRSTDVQLPTPTPTPTPISSIEEAKASSRRQSDLPACPAEDLVALYHEALPDLPMVRMMTDKRRDAIRKFWRWVFTSKKSDGTPRAQSVDDAVAWIRAYFERAGQNEFLMGKNDRNWKAGLDYLMTERGRIQVIERTAA